MKDFETISAEAIPKDENGQVLIEIFVYFTHAKKFIRFLSIGDSLDPQKLSALKDHSDPQLYIKRGALAEMATPKTELHPLQSIRQELDALGKQDLKTLNQKIRDELKTIFEFLKKDPEKISPEEGHLTLLKMESLAEDILAKIAPDVEDLRKFLLGNLKYALLMEDAAAITSIAVTTALAHGFDSRAIYRDLALACTVMDAPLAELPERARKQYFLDMTKLDPKSLEVIRQHPIVSAQAFSLRIKSFSPTVVQLILGHHELFNSKGYPKGTRSELLPTVARSLALAVDLFEHMKRAKLSGKELDLLSAAEELRQSDVPSHLRRHNQKLLSSLIEFLDETGKSGV